MAKKISESAQRTSPKQKFEAYRLKARTFINEILYPRTQTIFTIASYSADKKPNAASVPELLAIVGTAQKLGKKVQVEISGINELKFVFVDTMNIPAEL